MKYQEVVNRYISSDDENHSWPQIVAIVVASLASVNCGALFSWPSPAIPILISNTSHIENLTIEEASYFAVIPPISAALASSLGALLVDVIGRKKTLMLMTIPYLLSWVLIAIADNLYTLYISRALTGLGDAVLFSAVPNYVGEIAEPNVRGSWGNLVAIGIYFGQFWINLIGAYCDIKTTAMIFGCLPVIQFVLTSFLPESPYFLLMKDKTEEARKALQILRWRRNCDDEFISLTKDVNRQISESGTYKDLVTIPTNRKALIISIALRGTQQLSGLPAFGIYTQLMFIEAGGSISPASSAIIYAGALLLAISCAAFVVGKFGRKPLMTFSSVACAIVLATEATYFYVSQNTEIDTSDLKWVPLAGMLVYILVCSIGLGIIPTLMLGELFSASVKGKALGILNISFSIYILSVSKLFQSLTSAFGMYVPFYFFSVCCLGGAVFSYYCIPETKGKTLEEIQQDLKRK